MENWLIREENYKEEMDTVVWPYLRERRRELRSCKKENEALAVYNYHADNASQVVVISHGFTETAHKYAEVIYYFLIHGYEVYILDHCGHGKSYRMVEDICKVHVDSYNRYVRDLMQVVSLARKEHPELPLTLYGHSMGGGIAGVAAGRKPEWFDRVILSSPMIQPQAGGIPWGVTALLAEGACLLGKSEEYIAGHGPYQGLEDFASSAAMSKARFDYYQAYRVQEPSAQTSGASYGWIRAAVHINRELMKETYKKLKMPFLLLQAESDQYVSNEAQERFMELLKKENGNCAEMVQISGTKHEIFNAQDETVDSYWKQILG